MNQLHCQQNADYYPAERGKLAAPFLEKGMIIGVKRTFRVEAMVGGGGFGQIFRAIDLESKLVVAVKVEPKSSESGRIVLELNILVQLSHSTHIPKVYYSGEVRTYNFIIMQLLGSNLADLRKFQKSRSFSVETTSRIGIQCLEGLKQIHALGYIHRDIKPSNICAGIGEHRRVLYIVDFGMARRIVLPDGTFRPERVYASFRGTTRYVSLAAHERKEQGFVDDIWSLFFSLLELVEGLPWKSLIDQDQVCHAKRQMLANFQSRKMGRNFELFPQILENTKRTESVDYERLIGILKSCCGSFNELNDFEWDDHDEQYR
uniref:Protein kinase domain-containing protein n=2 Tax=Caenorhabditis tropicalis TaxID=1561998 RepID=A0A1I7TM13_9PELO